MLKFSKKRIFLLAIAFGMRYTSAQKQRSSCRLPSREEKGQPGSSHLSKSTYYKDFMKLHLPKMLLTAVLAAAQVFAEQVVYLSDNATNSITYTESGRLLYDHTDTDGLINFTGDIDLSTYTIWVGPGTNGAQQASQSTRVELSGVISGSEALNLNEYSSESGGDVVYVLSNADNTFSGTVNLAHGGSDNSYVQLSLTSNSLSSATVEFENKSKEILSIEANATLMGIKGSIATVI